MHHSWQLWKGPRARLAAGPSLFAVACGCGLQVIPAGDAREINQPQHSSQVAFGLPKSRRNHQLGLRPWYAYCTCRAARCGDVLSTARGALRLVRQALHA